MSKGKTQGYTDFYKRGGANAPGGRGNSGGSTPTYGVPKPVGGDKEDPTDDARKLALKRRLSKSPAKYKGFTRVSNPDEKDPKDMISRASRNVYARARAKKMRRN
jgi:hypothetical protein